MNTDFHRSEKRKPGMGFSDGEARLERKDTIAMVIVIGFCVGLLVTGFMLVISGGSWK